MFDIITIGSTTRDAFVEADFPTVPWPKTSSGRAYVLPLGEKFGVRKIFFTSGGNSANASVTFARQGFKTACFARTGHDVSGEEIRRRLKKEGVETKFMNQDSSLPTAYSVLLLEEFGSGKGERTILSYHGASDYLAFGDLRLAEARAGWWYVSLAGESDKIFVDLMKTARRQGAAVAFNPSGHHLRHRRGEILKHLKDLSFLVLNEEEAAILTGISFKKEKEVFKKLDKIMPGILAVTNGREGVTVSDGKFVYKTGIFREKKLVDRTGAGDAFGSGFVAGLMRRQKENGRLQIRSLLLEDIKYAIRLASANATSVVEKIGASEGALIKNEFEKSARWKKFPIRVAKL